MATSLPRRVAIIGAEARGLLVAARLACAGVPVVLVGRPAQVRAVQEQGLQLKQPWRRTVTLRGLHAVAGWGELAAEETAAIELAVLTSRVQSTQAAVAGLAGELDPAVPLVVLQEGVGGAEVARAQAGQRPLLAAVATFAAVQPHPGVVRCLSHRGGLGLAPVQAPQEAVGHAERLFAAAGLATQVYADYRAMVWSNLLLHMLGNAVPAIVNLPPERVFRDLALCRLELAAFREALAVMRALGISPVGLPGYPVPAFAAAMRKLPVPILHRLLPLLLQGRRLRGRARASPARRLPAEVEYLNGAVVRAGRELGVPVPANALIHRTLTAMKQGTIPRHAYADNPHGLLAPLR